MSDWEDFFDKNGDMMHRVDQWGEIEFSFSVEKMYQMFKARFIAETKEIDISEMPEVAEDALESLRRRHDPDLVPKWRPIETTPKDGTELLLFDGFMYLGSYAWTAENGDVLFQGSGPAFKPTHWMPLPAPPKPV